MNQTRPSCARVKVEVDLLREFPKRINIGMRKQSGEVTEKWITIRYDHVPKYCKTCKIQGHDEEQCYVLNPNLYPKENVEKEEEMEKGGESSGKGENTEGGRGVGGGRQGGGKTEQIRHKKNIQHDQEGITTGNNFGALNDQEECGETQGGQKVRVKGIETKKWVEEVFQKTSKIDEGNSIKNTEEKINRVDDEETAGSESFKNSAVIEIRGKQKCSELDARSSNMGNTCLAMVEFQGVQDNDGILSENKIGDNQNQGDEISDLQELTAEEIQKRRDKEEDDEFDEIIDKVGRDWDLSSRKIKLLESGAKKSKANQNTVPLQVKTRSSKERSSEDISQ
ncbi:hypothetical protein KY290_031362 [Solanum tuberosum]|uniref:Uncharacterized protein n=1 Tax=Solanum tuberosum TaxID=4113 RepID=A0ABQ7U9R1_SOLTU|nr:hypothetical protein KY290_031362 [Solanum tuberosum]